MLDYISSIDEMASGEDADQSNHCAEWWDIISDISCRFYIFISFMLSVLVFSYLDGIVGSIVKIYGGFGARVLISNMSGLPYAQPSESIGGNMLLGLSLCIFSCSADFPDDTISAYDAAKNGGCAFVSSVEGFDN